MIKTRFRVSSRKVENNVKEINNKEKRERINGK